MPVVWSAIFASVLPNVGGWAGAVITAKEVPNWYDKDLKKPWFTPPNWAFGPAWTTLYTSMGYASYLVWRDGGGFNGPARLPLALYGGQLALNWAWTPIFFGSHSLKWGLYEIVALYFTAGATMCKFYTVNETAGYIFVPYMAWLSLATALTYWIYKHNPEEKKSK